MAPSRLCCILLLALLTVSSVYASIEQQSGLELISSHRALLGDKDHRFKINDEGRCPSPTAMLCDSAAQLGAGTCVLFVPLSSVAFGHCACMRPWVRQPPPFSCPVQMPGPLSMLCGSMRRSEPLGSKGWAFCKPQVRARGQI